MTLGTSDKSITHKQKRQLSLLLFLIFATFIAYDVYHLMTPNDGQVPQINMEIIEALILLTGATAFVSLWQLTKREERNQIRFANEILRIREDRDVWKSKHTHMINEFKDYIMGHFVSWGLTQSEIEIGYFLLQGFSFEDIAEIRQVSPRTIRNQSLSIYAKSGLSGKHELASYFLEELLMNTRTLSGKGL